MRLFLISLLVALFTLKSLVAFQSHDQIYNGQAFYLELPKRAHTIALNLYFNKKPYALYTHPKKRDKWYALVPVSFYTKAGTYKLYAEFVGSKGLYKEHIGTIKIFKKAYKKEQLRVDPSRVKLSKKSKKRVAKEYEEARFIYTHSQKEFLPNKPFKAAMNSYITSYFGTERLFNGTTKSYHSGIDYRAKHPTLIYSVNKGLVRLAKERFYAGGSVIVDHGHGIFSCYYHMSTFFVKKGQKVVQLQKLGLSGASGRVSGPHLHYSMKLHGVTVDPLQFTKLLNRYLF